MRTIPCKDGVWSLHIRNAPCSYLFFQIQWLLDLKISAFAVNSELVNLASWCVDSLFVLE